MGLFRKRATEVGTGDPGDDQILAILAKDYGPLGKPRHWVQYLYVADEPAAQAVRVHVEAGGWRVQRVEAAAEGPGWAVIAEQHEVSLTPSKVRAAREFFQGVAAAVPGCVYDGWEASG